MGRENGRSFEGSGRFGLGGDAGSGHLGGMSGLGEWEVGSANAEDLAPVAVGGGEDDDCAGGVDEGLFAGEQVGA